MVHALFALQSWFCSNEETQDKSSTRVIEAYEEVQEMSDLFLSLIFVTKKSSTYFRPKSPKPRIPPLGAAVVAGAAVAGAAVVGSPPQPRRPPPNRPPHLGSQVSPVFTSASLAVVGSPPQPWITPNRPPHLGSQD